MENLMGAKIFVENLRGVKNFHHFPKKHSVRVSGLKKDWPLKIGFIFTASIIVSIILAFLSYKLKNPK